MYYLSHTVFFSGIREASGLHHPQHFTGHGYGLLMASRPASDLQARGASARFFWCCCVACTERSAGASSLSWDGPRRSSRSSGSRCWRSSRRPSSAPASISATGPCHWRRPPISTFSHTGRSEHFDDAGDLRGGRREGERVGRQAERPRPLRPGVRHDRPTGRLREGRNRRH